MTTKIHSITTAEGLAKLPGPKGERFAELFKHGTLSVELYAPRGKDPQKPHTRDEIYVVVTGTGEFVGAGIRRKFQPGDVLFVAAHASRISAMTLQFGSSSTDRKAENASFQAPYSGRRLGCREKEESPKAAQSHPKK